MGERTKCEGHYSLCNPSPLPRPWRHNRAPIQRGTPRQSVQHHIVEFPIIYLPALRKYELICRWKAGLPYVNSKHLYYIFRFFCKLDYKVNTFIHAPTLSLDEVKHEVIAANIMKTEA